MLTISNRRSFLKNSLATGALAIGGLVYTQCAPTKKPAAAKAATPPADPCEDLTGVDPVDVQKRKSLGYTNKSPMPDSQCDNCKLWVPAQEGKECGGCLLFTGPVNPEGHCTYWAPRV
ncbi:Tat (twin-arginine translocation) pathway signal sequence [Dyadobacter soli]|uniref:Tat (Twin-arginine translocation) pathway signal sequence n=1 Tax=Dyadobacter soli TaxID=659014 RepID=A0A1G7Y6D7_9BACT|nr:high-potential iron-sulfur protein [Dyadobacter soli]SDG92025.1 Tat (twin-arginine translocation) pathway signal sequence [Dyadobacter soli]